MKLRRRREDDGGIVGGRCDDIHWYKVEGLLFYCVFANVLGNLLEFICVTTKNVLKFDGLHKEPVLCRCLMGCLFACTYRRGSQLACVGNERKKPVIDCHFQLARYDGGHDMSLQLRKQVIPWVYRYAVAFFRSVNNALSVSSP